MPKFDTLVEQWSTSKPPAWSPWDDDTNKYVAPGPALGGPWTNGPGSRNFSWGAPMVSNGVVSVLVSRTSTAGASSDVRLTLGTPTPTVGATGTLGATAGSTLTLTVAYTAGNYTLSIGQPSPAATYDTWPNLAPGPGTLRLGYISAYVGLQTVAENYDITGSTYVVPIPGRPTLRGQQLGMGITPTGSNRYIGATFEFDTIVCYVDGVTPDVAFSDTTAKWFRLREAAGTIYHETSVDGVTWTVRRSTSAGLPAPLTACAANFFAGTFVSNVGGQATVGPLNSSGGRSVASAGTGVGTLGASVTSRSGAISGPFTGTGTMVATVAAKAYTVPAPGITATGTMSAVAAQTQLRVGSFSAIATATATPRPGYRAALASSASGTLVATSRARIVAEGSVDLATVWLNVATNRAESRSFETMSGLSVNTERDGEVRRYTTGRLRSVLKAGQRRTATLTLPALNRSQVAWLEQYVGELLCYRDDRGRKFYGVFMSVPVTEHPYNDEADVQLAVLEVSYSEVV